MLLNAPPGYSPAAINHQSPGQGPAPSTIPGNQSLQVGYTQGAPAGSMLPSSYLPPSSSPNPFANQQQPNPMAGGVGGAGLLGANNMPAIVHALGGANGR